jgi:hypothetical protein
MSYYYEKTSSYLTELGVKRTLGSSVLTWADDRKQELGLFPARNVSYDYNPYTHTVSGATWTKYDTDSDFLVANPDAKELDDVKYPGYFGQRSITELSDSDKEITILNAKRVVFEETADRMARVAGASIALRYNALSLSDSASTLADNFAASDSDIFNLAYDIQQGNYNDFPTLDQDYLGTTSIVEDITSVQNLDFSGLPTTDPGVVGKLWNHNGDLKVSI